MRKTIQVIELAIKLAQTSVVDMKPRSNQGPMDGERADIEAYVSPPPERENSAKKKENNENVTRICAHRRAVLGLGK